MSNNAIVIMSHVTVVIVSYVEKMMWQMWSDFEDYSNDMTGYIFKKRCGGKWTATSVVVESFPK